MKKLLSLILALMLAFSLAACTEKKSEEAVNPSGNEVVENEEAGKEPEVKPEEEKEEEKEELSEEKPEAKPEVKPEETPEAKPEVKPETKPEEKPEEPKTVGQTLLSAFKKSATDSSSALSIAEALITNEVIVFGGGAVPVEEGYLVGFENAEIKGFSEGAMFAPMIGTIPFVGYVFTLADGTNAADFIATLKESANLRWNICTSADEMVTGSQGNKVFFVMCPTSFEEAE